MLTINNRWEKNHENYQLLRSMMATAIARQPRRSGPRWPKLPSKRSLYRHGKRAENLQEVPIAVSAFTEAQIESAGIQRPADFIGLMPNVTMVDSANVGDTQVSIRGIVSTRDAESTFALCG